MINKIFILIASYRGTRKLLRLFQRQSFIAIHSWPLKKFVWTDKTVSFCLSFDCDNPEDYQAIPDLLALLEQYRIKSSFVVCGELVEEHPEAYVSIVNKGHEIISHGYSKHLKVFPDNSVRSTLFYHNLPEDRIDEEVGRNHECLKRIFDFDPIGFRVPHFGTFQNPEHFKVIYKILAKYGYNYDTSATAYSFKKLRLWDNPFGLIEFPLSGYVGVPLSVFDSWSLLKAPGRRFKDEDFFIQFKSLIDIAVASKQAIFLNVYFDPSHVARFKGFKSSLDYLNNHRHKVWVGLYKDMVESII